MTPTEGPGTIGGQPEITIDCETKLVRCATKSDIKLKNALGVEVGQAFGA